MTNYFEFLTNFFGKAAFAIPIYLFSLSTLFMSYIYCKSTNPSELVSNIVVYLPVISTALICILNFYSKNFWSFFAIFTFLIGLLFLLSIYTLKVTMPDKSGVTIVVFTGFIIMFIFTATGIGKLCHAVFQKFSS